MEIAGKNSGQAVKREDAVTAAKRVIDLTLNRQRLGVNGSGVVRIDIRRHSVGFGQFLVQRNIAEGSRELGGCAPAQVAKQSQRVSGG
jgi:hypothetical protein